MNVLITGIAGFIGSHLAERLQQRGHFVVGIDDLSGGFSRNVPQGIPFYKEDCADFAAMQEILRNHVHGSEPFDTLVHCAANAREGASQFQPVSVTHRNLMAYVSVLTAALQVGVKKVVLFSSMSVYGGQQTPFDETFNPQPVDVYAVNKAAMEKVTAILSAPDVHDFTVVILRPHNVFGCRQSLSDRFRNVVAIFMNLIMRNEPITVYGDGEQTRAFSYIGDSAPAMVKAVEQAEALSGRVINIGGMEPVSVNELLREVCRAMGKPHYRNIKHLPDRPCEVKHAFTTSDLSVELLGYEDKIGWRKGVWEMAVWAQDMGPQEWKNTQPLELVSTTTPRTWL